MSKLEVDAIEPQSGTTLTLGASGDAVNIASGATITDFKSTGIDDNATSTAITIDSSQKVGIGTASPAAKFNVNSGASNTNTIFDSTDASVLNLYRDDTGSAQIASTGGIFTFATGGDTAFAGLSEAMRIDSSGKIGINNTNPLYYLDIKDTSSVTPTMVQIEATGATSQPMHILNFSNGNDPGGKYFSFRDSGGEKGHISAAGGSAIGYYTSSDHRLKENVVTMPNATDRLKQLKPKRFNFIASADTTVDGFLAHEVSSVVPEAITGIHNETETKEKVVVSSNGQVIAENIEQADWEAGKIADEEGNTKYPTDSTWEATKVVPVYQGIDQSKLVPLLVKTIQELEARITALENA